MAFERLYQLSPVLGSVQDSISDHLWSHGLFLVSVDDKPKTTPPTKGPGEKSPDYYANVGDAIRTLRDDIPDLFTQDLNCEYQQKGSGSGIWVGWVPGQQASNTSKQLCCMTLALMKTGSCSNLDRYGT
jgi:hypothetical protein